MIFSFISKLLSGVPIYKLDAASLGCGFALWKIITLGVGSTIAIIVTIIVARKMEINKNSIIILILQRTMIHRILSEMK